MASNESVLPSENKNEDPPQERESVALETEVTDSLDTISSDEKKKEEKENEETKLESQEVGTGEDKNQIVKLCDNIAESLQEEKSDKNAQNIELSESNIKNTFSDVREHLPVPNVNLEQEKKENIGETGGVENFSHKMLDPLQSDIAISKDIDHVIQPVESKLPEPHEKAEADSKGNLNMEPKDSTIPSSESLSKTDSLTKSSADPLTKSSADPLTKSSDDLLTKSSADPLTKSSADPLTKTSADPLTKSSADPLTKTSAESLTKTSADPLTKTSADPLTKTSAESLTKTSDDPLTKTSSDPLADPLTNVSADPLTKISAEPVLEAKEGNSESKERIESTTEDLGQKVEHVCEKSEPSQSIADTEIKNGSSQRETETEIAGKSNQSSSEVTENKEPQVFSDIQKAEKQVDESQNVHGIAVSTEGLSKDRLESVPESKAVEETGNALNKSENVLIPPQTEKLDNMTSHGIKLTEKIQDTEKNEPEKDSNSEEKEVANFPMSKFSRSSTFEDGEEKMDIEESEQKIMEETKSVLKPKEDFQLKHDRVENLKTDSKAALSPDSVDTSEDSELSTDLPSSPGTTKSSIKEPSFVAAFKETAMDVEGENSMDVPMFDTPLGTPISMLADESIDNQDTRASVASNDVSGPTPTKKPRMGSLISARKEFVKLVITVDKLYEYQWPQGEGEWHMLQEQVSEYLSIKSFKRKYPDMYRRFVDKEEKEFLMDRGVVTETHCDLGLTAVRSEDIYDLMYKDYPEKYEEFLTYMHGKQRQTIYEQHKEYDVPNVEKSKLAEYMKKAVKSAAEFNAQMQKERREERKAFFDLQTFNVHYPVNKYKKLPPELTKASSYPIALIPGQFQDHYTTYTSDELKYLPINTAMYDAPKWMEPEQPKETNQTSEVDDSQGEKTASSDGDSDSGSESGSDTGEEKEDKDKEKPVKAEPVKETTCRRCEIKNKNKKRIRRVKEEIINCSECGAGGHPTCLELTEEMVGVIQTYPWQCMECKTCVECMDPYDEDKMMFCDRCDRGYHTFCVGMKAIPTGRWECKSCKGSTTSTTETPKSK